MKLENLMANQRREKIMDLLREDGSAKVANLAKLFKVTEVTIRQDLEKLEKGIKVIGHTSGMIVRKIYLHSPQ